MKFILLFIFFFQVIFAYDTLWFRTLHFEKEIIPLDLAKDPFGHLIIGGCSKSRIDDIILIIKFSPRGDTFFSKIFDEEGDDYLGGLTCDKEGNIVAVGGYYLPQEELGAYVIKYDNNGNLLWFKKFTINSYCFLTGVVCDDSNNIIVSGYYNGGNGDDGILIKYSKNGDSLWAKTYDFGGTFEGLDRLILDKEGNIIATGECGEFVSYDLLTAKFDKNGNLIWQSRLDFSSEDWGTEVVIDSFNNIYVCGWSGDPYISSYYSFVIKYNKDGDIIWKRDYHQNYENYLFDITIDCLGNILACGTEIDSNQIKSTFLIKYNFWGDTLLTHNFNFSTHLGMWGGNIVSINDSNYLYISGGFHNGNNWDIYLMKLFYYPAISEEENSTKIIFFQKERYLKEIFDIAGKKSNSQKFLLRVFIF